MRTDNEETFQQRHPTTELAQFIVTYLDKQSQHTLICMWHLVFIFGIGILICMWYWYWLLRSVDSVECDWYSDDRSNVYFDWLSAYTLWQMLLMMTIKRDVKGRR